jgi:2-dehydro-3-deoxy-D-arabinonate dehydratase
VKLYNTRNGPLLEADGRFVAIAGESWDELFCRDDMARHLQALAAKSASAGSQLRDADLLAPIGSQEVWAAGVTYYRSRDARMEEAEAAGGGSFYDRVYSAARPELFFKSTPHRVAGPGEDVRIRKDSKWNVPEPELTLVVTPRGKIIGYTVGNDMSSRDIEGENPLYLPQAKVYDKSCALGPGILVTDEPLPPETRIHLEIRRAGKAAFEGSTTLAAMKRKPQELVEYLYRDNSFPAGCFLLTGTGVVPPSTFTLEPRDEVRITIDSIGTLVNRVAGAA